MVKTGAFAFPPERQAAGGLGEAGFLARELRDWEASPARRRQLLGELYYRGEQQILRRKRTVIGPEGAPVEVTNLPNARLTDNQYARLLDQKVNYLLGRPPVVVSEDRDWAAALRGVFGPGFFRALRGAAHDALAGGCGWLFACPDGTGGLRLRRFRPWEVLPFWADEDHTELDGALRVWEREEHTDRGRTRAGYAELYTRDGVFRFRREGRALVPDEPFHLPYLTVSLGGRAFAYNWETIPLFAVKNGPAEVSLLERVKSLQDAVNLILSNFVNGMQEDPRNTILVLVNYDGQNLGEFRRNLAAYGAVKVRSDAGAPGGDVKTLSLEVNGENYKAVLELLKRALVENARGYDAKDLRAAGTPNEMNLRSVFSDIDLDADMLEAELQSMFRELVPLASACLAARGVPVKNTEASLVFNRDTIVNESQVIADVAGSANLLSRETLLEQHPWVEDVQRELGRLRREQAVSDSEKGEAT
jgi:SPP1 family phage portal protein